MSTTSREMVRDDLTRLVHRSVGVREFSLAAGRILERAVAFDGVCVLTMDPATMLPTGEVVENGLPSAAMRRMADKAIFEKVGATRRGELVARLFFEDREPALADPSSDS